jgi:hypothetical protein
VVRGGHHARRRQDWHAARQFTGRTGGLTPPPRPAACQTGHRAQLLSQNGFEMRPHKVRLVSKVGRELSDNGYQIRPRKTKMVCLAPAFLRTHRNDSANSAQVSDPGWAELAPAASRYASAFCDERYSTQPKFLRGPPPAGQVRSRAVACQFRCIVARHQNACIALHCKPLHCIAMQRKPLHCMQRCNETVTRSRQHPMRRR